VQVIATSQEQQDTRPTSIQQRQGRRKPEAEERQPKGRQGRNPDHTHKGSTTHKGGRESEERQDSHTPNNSNP